MTTRIAINGFGRIGRSVLRRIASTSAGIDVVAINSRGLEAERAAHLFRYDTVHGRFEGDVRPEVDALVVNGRSFPITAHDDPGDCTWGDLDVDVVIEATGAFNDRNAAARHLDAGARRVVVTAPVDGADATIVVGVNDADLDLEHHTVISAASCTTNALAPILAVLDDTFGVRSGLMTTIHAFTRDQQLLDSNHRDLRRARAATRNVVPTTTGSAQLIDVVLPGLAGKVVGLAVRVPVPDVSLVDLSVVLDGNPSADEVNASLVAAATRHLDGVLGTTAEPLVSSDFHGDDHSAVIDLPSTRRAPDGHVKVLAWYDNEAGYAARVVDLVRTVDDTTASRLPAGRHTATVSGGP